MFTQRRGTAHAHHVDGTTLIVVGDSLTLAECAGLKPVLHNAITGEAARIDIDVADVGTMDAYAVRFLRQMWGWATERGHRFRVIGASAEVRRLFDAEDRSDSPGAPPLSVHDDRSDAPARPPLPCCDLGDGGAMDGDPIGSLLREAYALPHSDPRRNRLRAHAIELGLPFTRRIARRFSGRGEPIDDLAQVAAMGLIKAVDRYDPAKPAGFWPFAAPTIIGELRKHFRDKGWGIRVPRRLQDVWLQIRGEADGLAQRLGRTVTARDIATALQIDESLVTEARLASRSYAPASLSAPVLETGVLSDYIAISEDGFEAIDNEQTVRRALLTLPKRMRHIVGLRFRHEMTQAEIAAVVGLSQMHVSRILAEALALLREVIIGEVVSAGIANGDADLTMKPAARGDVAVVTASGGGGRAGHSPAASARSVRSAARPSRTRRSPTTKP